jgi:CRISPR-associated protein Csx3
MKYNINFEKVDNVVTRAQIGFGDPGTNGEILTELSEREGDLKRAVGYGKLLVVNGPASLPVAMFIAHLVGHNFGAVACFDPKMAGYVVAISHDPDYAIGDVITLE